MTFPNPSLSLCLINNTRGIIRGLSLADAETLDSLVDAIKVR